MKVNKIITAFLLSSALLTGSLLEAMDRPSDESMSVRWCLETVFPCCFRPSYQATPSPQSISTSNVEAVIHNGPSDEIINGIREQLVKLVAVEDQSTLRELYLRCLRPQLPLTLGATGILTNLKLIEGNGNASDGTIKYKVKHPKVILNWLLTDEECFSADDWYEHQQVRELKARLGEPIATALNNGTDLTPEDELIFLEMYRHVCDPKKFKTKPIKSECKQPNRQPFRLKETYSTDSTQTWSVIPD